MSDIDEARKTAGKRGIGNYERHIFLCIGPDCCTEEQGQAAWGQLKKAAAKLNGSGESGRIYRTKVGCLRICGIRPHRRGLPRRHLVRRPTRRRTSTASSNKTWRTAAK